MYQQKSSSDISSKKHQKNYFDISETKFKTRYADQQKSFSNQKHNNDTKLSHGIAWKVSKYGVFSGPNAGKFKPEITPYLDTFYAV